MDDKKTFIDKCIMISSMRRDELVKHVLSERFSDISDASKSKTPGDMPTGMEIITFVPSSLNYPDYAFSLCSMNQSREDMVRHLLEYEVELCDKKNEEDKPSPEKKRRRGMSRRSDDTKIPPSKDLPSILSLFTKDDASGEASVIANMPDILETYFPSANCVYAGIYANLDRSEFVLLAVDNGRYRTSWRSSGTQNKLKWYTSHEDSDKSIMKSITNDSSTVHIARKRNGEIRYMGKCNRIEDINIEEGWCSMFVS